MKNRIKLNGLAAKNQMLTKFGSLKNNINFATNTTAIT